MSDVLIEEMVARWSRVAEWAQRNLTRWEEAKRVRLARPTSTVTATRDTLYVPPEDR